MLNDVTRKMVRQMRVWAFLSKWLTMMTLRYSRYEYNYLHILAWLEAFSIEFISIWKVAWKQIGWSLVLCTTTVSSSTRLSTEKNSERRREREECVIRCRAVERDKWMDMVQQIDRFDIKSIKRISLVMLAMRLFDATMVLHIEKIGSVYIFRHNAFNSTWVSMIFYVFDGKIRCGCFTCSLPLYVILFKNA